MIFENENDADGIQNVLREFHSKYVPHASKDNQQLFTEQGFVADQLSVERGVNCLLQLKNGFTAEECLEGIHMEVADFHACMKFLQV